MIELLPAKATFATGEAIGVEARGAAEGSTVRLFHLDRLVAEAAVEDGRATFSAQAEGGYGVECGDASGALDVLASPLQRLRYGFVSRYEADRVVDGVAENVRRFHLNAVQFYDWMYRHADLVPAEDGYEDALGQRLSLATVRSLIGAIAGAGSLPLAYAAVYAVGDEAWPQWQTDGLYRADGTPWSLGDFLRIVDPSSERWLTHLCADLRKAMDVGFAGFHLDQYGWPKWGLRDDGRAIDVADALPALVSRVANELPAAQLVFNNVNDFPTWATVAASQAVTYIEVWAPHTRLHHLADLVAKARALEPSRPVVLAAYLPAYAEDATGALVGETLQLATVFSSGATALLHGEESAVLTDPYYVRHHTLDGEAQDVARRYFDFAVRYGDLLFDPGAVDVTRSHFGGENEEVRVDAPVPVSADAVAGALWCRVFRVGGELVIHLIDLSRQIDDEWATPKRSGPALAGVRVSVLRRNREPAAILAATPEGVAALRPLRVETTDRYDTVDLPSFITWSLVQVREEAE